MVKLPGFAENRKRGEGKTGLLDSLVLIYSCCATIGALLVLLNGNWLRCEPAEYSQQKAQPPDKPDLIVKMGNLTAELDAVVAVPIHWTRPAEKAASALELEISYPVESFHWLRAERAKKNIQTTILPGTAAGTTRMRIENAPNVTASALPPGLIAFLVFRIHAAAAGKTNLVGHGTAVVGNRTEGFAITGGTITVLAPRLDVESRGAPNIDPYVSSSCFFYMH